MTKPLCLGEECGRCLMACPADAILQWGLDKKKCAPYASPYGFSHVVAHVGNVLRASNADEQIALLRSSDTFNLWQSLLRGVGAYTGCTRCVDVCPVGQDYVQHLQDIQEEIPEATPEKAARLAEMRRRQVTGEKSEGLERSRRWIGEENEKCKMKN
jgi:ferredoxin